LLRTCWLTHLLLSESDPGFASSDEEDTSSDEEDGSSDEEDEGDEASSLLQVFACCWYLCAAGISLLLVFVCCWYSLLLTFA